MSGSNFLVKRLKICYSIKKVLLLEAHYFTIGSVVVAQLGLIHFLLNFPFRYIFHKLILWECVLSFRTVICYNIMIPYKVNAPGHSDNESSTEHIPRVLLTVDR